MIVEYVLNFVQSNTIAILGCLGGFLGGLFNQWIASKFNKYVEIICDSLTKRYILAISAEPKWHSRIASEPLIPARLVFIVAFLLKKNAYHFSNLIFSHVLSIRALLGLCFFVLFLTLGQTQIADYDFTHDREVTLRVDQAYSSITTDLGKDSTASNASETTIVSLDDFLDDGSGSYTDSGYDKSYITRDFTVRDTFKYVTSFEFRASDSLYLVQDLMDDTAQTRYEYLKAYFSYVNSGADLPYTDRIRLGKSVPGVKGGQLLFYVFADYLMPPLTQRNINAQLCETNPCQYRTHGKGIITDIFPPSNLT